MKKIKVVIPARAGSKGLKNKHVQLINNKPLIFWTLDQFLSELGDLIELYISTDCDQIKNLCLNNYDNVKIIKRESSLATDTTSTEMVLQNIANSWKNDLKEDDSVIYASACEINRPKGILRFAIDSTINNNKIDTFMYGEKSHKHLWENNFKEKKLMRSWMNSYSPRQLDESNYLIEHSGLILITKLKYWLECKRFGGQIFVKELNEFYRHIDIHNKIDLKLASAILSE
tara:strand:+ start:120 stop:809 length:690 start_codon:yes stop_codon:yes gene_type:complete